MFSFRDWSEGPATSHTTRGKLAKGKELGCLQISGSLQETRCLHLSSICKLFFSAWKLTFSVWAEGKEGVG